MNTSRITQLCKERGITKRELEKVLGFGYRTIDNWSRHDPSVTSIAKVAMFFNVSIDELLKTK